MKKITILNIILTVLAMALAINLISPNITSNIIYHLDTSEPVCYFHNSGESNNIPLNLCCFEIQKQLTYKSTDIEDSDIKCYISESSGIYYLINHKALNYCVKEGYEIEVK